MEGLTVGTQIGSRPAVLAVEPVGRLEQLAQRSPVVRCRLVVGAVLQDGKVVGTHVPKDVGAKDDVGAVDDLRDVEDRRVHVLRRVGRRELQRREPRIGARGRRRDKRAVRRSESPLDRRLRTPHVGDPRRGRAVERVGHRQVGVGERHDRQHRVRHVGRRGRMQVVTVVHDAQLSVAGGREQQRARGRGVGAQRGVARRAAGVRDEHRSGGNAREEVAPHRDRDLRHEAGDHGRVVVADREHGDGRLRAHDGRRVVRDGREVVVQRAAELEVDDARSGRVERQRALTVGRGRRQTRGHDRRRALLTAIEHDRHRAAERVVVRHERVRHLDLERHGARGAGRHRRRHHRQEADRHREAGRQQEVVERKAVELGRHATRLVQEAELHKVACGAWYQVCRRLVANLIRRQATVALRRRAVVDVVPVEVVGRVTDRVPVLVVVDARLNHGQVVGATRVGHELERHKDWRRLGQTRNVEHGRVDSRVGARGSAAIEASEPCVRAGRRRREVGLGTGRRRAVLPDGILGDPWRNEVGALRVLKVVKVRQRGTRETHGVVHSHRQQGGRRHDERVGRRVRQRHNRRADERRRYDERQGTTSAAVGIECCDARVGRCRDLHGAGDCDAGHTCERHHLEADGRDLTGLHVVRRRRQDVDVGRCEVRDLEVVECQTFAERQVALNVECHRELARGRDGSRRHLEPVLLVTVRVIVVDHVVGRSWVARERDCRRCMAHPRLRAEPQRRRGVGDARQVEHRREQQVVGARDDVLHRESRRALNEPSAVARDGSRDHGARRGAKVPRGAERQPLRRAVERIRVRQRLHLHHWQHIEDEREARRQHGRRRVRLHLHGDELLAGGREHKVAVEVLSAQRRVVEAALARARGRGREDA